MKTKIIALFTLITCCVTAESQILKGGINLANVTITNDGDIDDASSLTSFQAGLLLNLKVIPFL
ncbi:MAG: hypothetical protein H7Y01_11270, partial [Ferruginibacter sp.]|nr:hypothetical protein [Chitinophagaceae bacterium]